MSTFDDSNDTNTISDILVPVDISGEPIKYNGNIATLAGIVYEVGQYAKRTGVLQLFLEHRAVDVGKGIIAVEDYSVIPFIQGTITDVQPRHMGDPCPPSTARLANFNSKNRSTRKVKPVASVSHFSKSLTSVRQ